MAGSTTTAATPPKDATTRRRLLPKWWRQRPTQSTMIQWVVVLPYVMGVVWHLHGHVRYSVLTGDFHNPKRSYIDENSLDPNHFQLYGTYTDVTTVTSRTMPVVMTSLCESRLKQETMTGVHLSCFQYHARNDHDHQTTPTWRTSKPTTTTTTRPNHGSFEILKIVPHAAGIVPSQEAIVLVVPSFGTTTTKESLLHQQQYQMSMIQFLQRLSSPTISPWLSKIVFIVAPLDNDAAAESTSASTSHTLAATVQSFLQVYLGTTAREDPESPSVLWGLPPEFLGSIIRHVLVMDWETFTPISSSNSSNSNSRTNAVTPEPQRRHIDDRNEIRILSSGRRGVLPNLDLTFLCKFIYERSNMVQQLQQIYDTSSHKYTMTDVVVHPYQKRIVQHMASIRHRIEQIEQTYTSILPTTFVSSASSIVSTIVSWYETLLPLVAYESLLMIGPYPPHTSALDHGIDSITLQGYFAATVNASTSTTNSNRNANKSILLPQQYMMEYVQRMELVMRSLSNLHERLHHSTSLYLLVSKNRFVKHEEYLIPTILLILPLLIRALLYIISSDDENSEKDDTSSRTDESDTNTNSTVEGRKGRHRFSLDKIANALFGIFLWSSVAIEVIRSLFPILRVPYILSIVPVLMIAIVFISVSFKKNTDDVDSNNVNKINKDNSTDESDTNRSVKKVTPSVPECRTVEIRKSRHQFSFTAIGQALLITFVWSTLAMDLILYARDLIIYLLPLLAFDNPYSPTESLIGLIGYLSCRYPMELIYFMVIVKLAEWSQKKSKGSPSILLCTIDRKHQRCLQFVSCLLAAYIHFGITFGHVSLAFPSALIWTPLLAFPTYHSRNENFVMWVGSILFFNLSLFIASPLVFLVPNVFPTYTPYVRYVYIPLHMLFCIQHIIPS